MSSKKQKVKVVTKKRVVCKDAQDDKVKRVMDEFKAGTLKSNGKIVTDHEQALAIALSEAGLSYKSLYQAQLVNKVRVMKSQTEHLLAKEIEREGHINRNIEKLITSRDDFDFNHAAAILGIPTREFMFRCIGVTKSLMMARNRDVYKAEVPIGTVHTWSDGTKHRKETEGWVPVPAEKTGGNTESKPSPMTDKNVQVESVDPKTVEYGLADFNKFVNSRDGNTPDRFRPWITTYSEKEYEAKNAKTYLSEDGKSGCAVAPDGDIVSVFSGAKGRLKKLINTAIMNGGNHLDCIGDKLASMYEGCGFEIYKTMPWDDQYAPPGWDYARDGRPRIYFMKLRKEIQTIVQMSKDTPQELDREALKKMDEALVPEQARAELDQYVAFMKGEGDLPGGDGDRSVQKSQKWQHVDESWWWHNPQTGTIEQTTAPGPHEAAADTTSPQAHGFREAETARVLDGAVRALSTNNFAVASSVLNGYLLQQEDAGRITRVQRQALEEALAAARDNNNNFRNFNLTDWLKKAEGQGQGNAPVSGTIAQGSAEFDEAQFRNMRDQVLDAGNDTAKVKRLLREYLADQYEPGTARDSVMKKMYQRLQQQGALSQADLDAMKNNILSRSLAGHLFRRGHPGAAEHEATRPRRTRTAPVAPPEPAIDPDTGEPVGAPEEPIVPGTRIGLTQTDEAFMKEFRSTNLKYRKLYREGNIEGARDLLSAYIKKLDFLTDSERSAVEQGIQEKFRNNTLSIDLLTKTKNELIRRRDEVSSAAQQSMSDEERFKHYMDAGDKDNASKELIRTVQNREMRPYQRDILVAEALSVGPEFNYKDFQKRTKEAESITQKIGNNIRDAHSEYFDWLSGLPEPATQGLQQHREFEQAWAMNHYIDSNNRSLTSQQQVKLKQEISEAMLNHYTGFKPKKFMETVDKHVAKYEEARKRPKSKSK